MTAAFRILRLFSGLLVLSAVSGPMAAGAAGVETGGVMAVTPPGVEVAGVDMLFRNWTTREGLPHNRVRAVIRSREGFLWLGTDAGVARFDGVDFQTWGLAEGLGAAAVFCLCETRDGSVWIGTQGGGVSCLSGERITRTWTTDDGLPENSVNHLLEDDSGALWASARGKLTRLENGRFEPIPILKGTAAGAMVKDGAGRVWVSFSPGDLRFWNHGEWMFPSGGDRARPGQVRTMSADPAGRIWLVDGDGKLWRQEGKDGGWQQLSAAGILPADVRSLTVDADGTVWFSFFRRGVAGWRDGRWLVPIPRSSWTPDLAEALFSFGGPPLWLTSSNGLFALTPLKFRIGSVEDAGSRRVSNDLGGLVEESPGSFLLATQGGGFFRWRDGVSTRLSDDPALDRPEYGNAAWKSPDGSVWLAGGKGVFQFRDGRETARPVFPASHRETWTVSGTRVAGGLWAGQGPGKLLELHGDRFEAVTYPGQGREPVKAIHEEKDGTLWVGTRGGGLYRRDTEGAWRRFGKSDGLPSEVIRFLTPAPEGGLWIGTAGAGLVLHREGEFSSLARSGGLPDDTVSQLVTDDSGRLWLGTNRGLAVFSAEESRRMERGDFSGLRPLVLNLSDGLPSEEFTIVPPVKAAGGTLVFATTKGFVRLDPALFQTDPARPPVFIRSIRANGKELPVPSGIQAEEQWLTLPPGVERLEFEFTALHFEAPERLAFRSRLSGPDEEDSAADAGQVSRLRRVEYRNLQPGDYLFEVSATTGNGLWSPSAAGVNLRVRPHFWQTWWFRAAAVVPVLALVIGVVRVRERRRARRRIEALEKERAVQAERARIARDLHDDVGASLTQVALLSEVARGDLAVDPARAEEAIREIFTTARELTRSLDEIVWAVNPAQDTIAGFTAYLATSAQSLVRGTGLAVRLDFPENPPGRPLSSPVRHHLCLAAREALHNAVKHSGASTVRLSLRLSDQLLTLVVEDNGQGILPAESSVAEASGGEGGNGLGNLQSRMRQIGGTCTLGPSPGGAAIGDGGDGEAGGGGTRVEFTVPLND